MAFKFGGKIDLKIHWSLKKPHGPKGVARSGLWASQTLHAVQTLHVVKTFLVSKRFFREKDTNSKIGKKSIWINGRTKGSKT